MAEGLDILTKVNSSYVDVNYRPHCEIRIKATFVLDDPFPDIPGLKPMNNTEKVEEAGRISDTEDQKTPNEIASNIAEAKANTRAIGLELLGDIPDADMAPPANIAFVCRLNRHTRDKDL